MTITSFLRSALTLCLTTSVCIPGSLLFSSAALAGDTSAAGRQSSSNTAGEGLGVSADPTPELMRGLAKEMASGDRLALHRLEAISAELYRDINYQKETNRVRSNLVLMQAAFEQLGKDAGDGNENAIKALKEALGMEALRSHVSNGLGIAAAAGNVEALEMLLNYKRYGILLSSAVFALAKPAAKNNEKAAAFLADVLDNPQMRALSHGASQGLVGAANAGNTRAKEALDAFAARNPK